MSVPDPPMALIAELTHRCPLRCPYCANPTALHGAGDELAAVAWQRVFQQAAALGVLHLHLSGGEPMARRDLAELVRTASAAGLYSNLITSGVLLDDAAAGHLARSGLDHVQISFQDTIPERADRIGGFAGGHARKLAAARAVKQAGLALTLNFVVHRQNLVRVPEMIDLAVSLGASRVEIAHVQYYGWALVNRDALLPDRAEVDHATEVVEKARQSLKQTLMIDYVPPDYHAARPKACMSGWGRRFMVVTPAGRALPCHAAETLPGFDFPSVEAATLASIWQESEAFLRFRGTAWMPEPCRSCERREVDWGGCRCQAFALVGDAAQTDPACGKSPHHALMADVVVARTLVPPGFVYRGDATA